MLIESALFVLGLALGLGVNYHKEKNATYRIKRLEMEEAAAIRANASMEAHELRKHEERVAAINAGLEQRVVSEISHHEEALSSDVVYPVYKHYTIWVHKEDRGDQT